MVKVYDMRKTVAHTSLGGVITLEQIEELEGYGSWLHDQIENADQAALEPTPPERVASLRPPTKR